MYVRLVGEMGVSRDDFLLRMKNWEIHAHIQGYLRRSREMWAVARWHAWWAIHNGMVDWGKQGIRSQKDMITFPWEEEDAPEISDEEIEELQSLMADMKKGR